MPQRYYFKELVYKFSAPHIRKSERLTYKKKIKTKPINIPENKQINRNLTSANNCHSQLLILNLAEIPFPALIFCIHRVLLISEAK